MRLFKAIIYTAAAASLLCGASGCKTTEANYKAAYDVAKARQKQTTEDDGLDRHTRDMLERQRRGHRSILIAGRDTLEVTTMFLKADKEGDSIPQYGIAVNEFTQVFNARAMCKRLRDNGFDGAYVVHTAQPAYYVVSAGTNDPAKIPALLSLADKVRDLGMGREFPRIIRSATYRPK